MFLKNNYIEIVADKVLQPISIAIFFVAIVIIRFQLETILFTTDEILIIASASFLLGLFLLFRRRKSQWSNKYVQRLFVTLLCIEIIFLAIRQYLFFFNSYITVAIDKFNYLEIIFLLFTTFTVAILTKANLNVVSEKETSNSRMILRNYYIPLSLAAFVAAKLWMIVSYEGTFIDEYTHIFSALSLLEYGQLANIYDGHVYIRGILATLLSTVSVFSFGKEVFFIKLTFALVGLLNFLLLYVISKRFFSQTHYQALLLLAFTLSPWVLFDHFYIRFYIFYELFILLFTYLIIRMIEQYEKKIDITNRVYAFFILFLFFFFISFDAGRLIIAFYVSVIFTYTYIFVFKDIVISRGIAQKLLNLPLKQKAYIITLLYISALIGAYALVRIGKIDISNISYSSSSEFKYYKLFFSQNLVTTFVFLGTVLLFLNTQIRRRYTTITPIIIGSFVLFVTNLFLPLDIQNTRSVLYFFPLYYLVAFLGASQFKKHSHYPRLAGLVIPIFMFAEIATNYPANFLQTPYIPKEVDYIDYTIYADTKSVCSEAMIIVSSNPGIAKFHGIEPAYYINTKFSESSWIQSNVDAKLAHLSNGIFYENYSNTEIITNLQDLIDIVSSSRKQVCIIHGGLPYSWLNESTRVFIEQNFEVYPKTYLTSEDYKRMRLYIISN